MGKITDMTREELRDFMNGNGEIHRYDSGKISWQTAFRLFEKTGQRVEHNCASCVGKVKEWLTKP